MEVLPFFFITLWTLWTLKGMVVDLKKSNCGIFTSSIWPSNVLVQSDINESDCKIFTSSIVDPSAI